MSFMADDSGGNGEPHRSQHDNVTTTVGKEEETERLRQELAAKDEALFDLQVSLQAVEAEKVHEIQALKVEHDQQVHLLQEQLRRAINEANVARMRAAATAGGQPQLPPPNPSGNFPPPMMMSTRGGAGASSSNNNNDTAAGIAAIAANDGRNAVVTPVAAAGADVPARLAVLTAAAPSSQHDHPNNGNDGSGKEGIPREIHCVQSAQHPGPQPDLRQQPLTWRANTCGEGPLLAGKILELVVAWKSGAGRQGTEAKSWRGSNHAAESDVLIHQRRRVAVPTGNAGSSVSSPVSAATATPFNLIQPPSLSPIPVPPPLSLPAHVFQILVRWSRTASGTSNIVTEGEVVLFCVEQVVSLHRQQLMVHNDQDINGSTTTVAPKAADSTPTMGDCGAILWKVLEWAIVLASPRGRRHLRQNFAVATCGDDPSDSSADETGLDAENIRRDNDSRSIDRRHGHNGYLQRRRRNSCIRSLKDGMGRDIRPHEISEVFRRPQSSGSCVISRWEESLLRDFMSIIQSAVTRWSSPEVSIPACRILLLLLGHPSHSSSLLPRESQHQEANDHLDPSTQSRRMSTLQSVAWMWGLLPSETTLQHSPSRAACPLHAWEDAASRLIELHTIDSNPRKNQQSQQPRRRLTGSPSETAAMHASTVSNLASEVPKSTAMPDFPPARALLPKTSCELTMAQLLQWMSSSLPLFKSFDILAAVSPRKESAPPTESSEDTAIGTSPPLLLRRLLASVLDVLEIVVFPRLEEATTSSLPPSASAVAEPRDSKGGEPCSRPAVDIITLMRFTSQCASFLAYLARCDPPCPTVVTGSTHKTTSDRGGRSAMSESLLVLLRVEMPTTLSTAASWDRAPSAISVITGLLHAAAVLQEGRDPYESTVAAPTAVREEEQKLIHVLVRFFHQLLLQVQWERRWRTDQRKIASSLAPSASGDAVSNDGSSSRAPIGALTTKMRPLVSFWQLLSPCRHWYVTASALLRHSSPNSSTSEFLERDDDGVNPDNDGPHRRDGGAASLDEDVRFMLRLQMDELVDDEEEILQEL